MSQTYFKLVPAGTTPHEGPRERAPNGGLLPEGFVRGYDSLDAFLDCDEVSEVFGLAPESEWEVLQFTAWSVRPNPPEGRSAPGEVSVAPRDVVQRAIPSVFLESLRGREGALAGAIEDRRSDLRLGPTERSQMAPNDVLPPKTRALFPYPPRAESIPDIQTACKVATGFLEAYSTRNGWFSPTEYAEDAPVELVHVADTRRAPREIEVLFDARKYDEDKHEVPPEELAQQCLDALFEWEPRMREWDVLHSIRTG